MIKKRGKKHYVLIKDFNTFMFDYTIHPGRKNFCCYNLQAFRTEGTLKCHINECFKINVKQKVKMLHSKIIKGK